MSQKPNIDNIVTTLLGSDLLRFLDTIYVPVDGTNQMAVRFRFATDRLNAELRAALQANGF